MILDGDMMAPHFGTWACSHIELPDPGVIVLGLVWNPDTHLPCVMLMEWRVVEEPTDYDSDHVFMCNDSTSQHKHKSACWFAAFEDVEMSDSERTLAPPMMWAECRWLVNTPFSICPDCNGLRVAGDLNHIDCQEEGEGE